MRVYKNEYLEICEQLADKPILIIDDESRIRHLLSKYFSKICFNDRQINHASTATEAIEQIDNKVYGLIILDLMLLKSSGFEVIRHLIEQERKTNLLAPPSFSGLGQSAQ
jgi:DNA-binding response OmpR family regulator